MIHAIDSLQQLYGHTTSLLLNTKASTLQQRSLIDIPHIYTFSGIVR
jgi:hypothetical protein